MTRLDEAHVVNLTWTEDEDGNVMADGHQSYDIDAETNEVSVFVDEKCARVVDAVDLPHAVSIVLASEAVVAYKLREKDRRAAR